jgi:peptidoglycan/LPS O-acetylase OafA/YrhL
LAPDHGVNLRSLEALRGVLAVYVMVGHARWLLWDGHFRWIQEPHPWWANALAYGSAAFRYGHEAVICFFVLSGFFIHFRWARGRTRGMERFDLADYARRRAHRLVPPYLLALAATLALDLAGRAYWPHLYLGETGDALLDSTFTRGGFTPESVGPALLLLPGALGRDFGSNGPLWSLGYEFLYYALYPLWLALRVRIGAWAYVAGCAAALGIAAVSPWPFLGSALLMYPLWLAGAAMAEHFLEPPLAKPRLLPSAVILAAGFVGFHFIRPPYVVLPYLALGIGAVSIAAAMPDRIVGSRVHWFWEQLGLRSYTIYITHFPFLALGCAIVFDTVGRRPSSAWLALGAIAAALAWCNLMWWLVERRFLHARFELAAGERRHA